MRILYLLGITGITGKMLNILKRYCMATGTDSAEDGVFHDRHMISVILRTPGSDDFFRWGAGKNVHKRKVPQCFPPSGDFSSGTHPEGPLCVSYVPVSPGWHLLLLGSPSDHAIYLPGTGSCCFDRNDLLWAPEGHYTGRYLTVPVPDRPGLEPVFFATVSDISASCHQLVPESAVPVIVRFYSTGRCVSVYMPVRPAHWLSSFCHILSDRLSAAFSCGLCSGRSAVPSSVLHADLLRTDNVALPVSPGILTRQWRQWWKELIPGVTGRIPINDRKHAKLWSEMDAKSWTIRMPNRDRFRCHFAVSESAG